MSSEPRPRKETLEIQATRIVCIKFAPPPCVSISTRTWQGGVRSWGMLCEGCAWWFMGENLTWKFEFVVRTHIAVALQKGGRSKVTDAYLGSAPCRPIPPTPIKIVT